jgi:DNA-directed RNA polymerase specialized sigma24 family protein
MIEDEVLKWRFKRGSQEALARIYAKYVYLLLSLAFGLLNDPHEAEDVIANERFRCHAIADRWLWNVNFQPEESLPPEIPSNYERSK